MNYDHQDHSNMPREKWWSFYDTAFSLALLLILAVAIMAMAGCSQADANQANQDYKALASAYLATEADAPLIVPVTKIDRKKCQDCKGTGIVRTGDGLSTTECEKCEVKPGGNAFNEAGQGVQVGDSFTYQGDGKYAWERQPVATVAVTDNMAVKPASTAKPSAEQAYQGKDGSFYCDVGGKRFVWKAVRCINGQCECDWVEVSTGQAAAAAKKASQDNCSSCGTSGRRGLFGRWRR